MSMPYGGSQPAVPQPNSPADPRTGPNLSYILALVAAGLAVVIYLMSFTDGAFAAGITTGLVLPLLLGGGLLAGAGALLRTERTLLPAALLTALGFLILLAFVVKSDSDSNAVVFITLIAGLLQLAACVVALLFDHGLIKMTPKAPSYGPPSGWSPPGGFPQQGYGAAPGYGQQQPSAGQYGGQQQYGGGQHYVQPGQSGHGSASGQPGQSGGAQQESRPQYGQQPYGQQPYGGQNQPGTPPGGFGSS